MKQNIEKHHRSTSKIKDEKFSVDNIGNYDLVLNLGAEQFKCAVIDEKLGRWVYFEVFDFTKVLNQEEILEQCKIIFDEHHILQAGFWKSVNCIVSSSYFTLLPKEFFDEKQSEDVLKVHFPKLNSKDFIFESHVPNSGPVAGLYYMPKSVHKFLDSFYPKIKIKYIHELSSVIEGLVNTAGSKTQTQLSAFFHGKFVSIILIDQGKIQFFNTFTIHNPEDAVYYILSVMNSVNISGKEGSIEVYGEIEEKSELYRQLNRFIKEVRMGERPKLLYYNYEFDEIPVQRHFETFAAYLCK